MNIKKIALVPMLLILALALTACGGKKEAAKADVKLSEIYAAFELGDNMMTFTQEDLSDLYGIEEADVKQFAGGVNTTGVKCDEILLVEANDADAAARVKEAMDNRYQSKLNELDGYLPDEYAIAKQCSVTTNGNFVAMIVAPNAQELTKASNAAF